MASIDDQLKDAVDKFKIRIQQFRTGRATPALVEDIVIDYYGTPTPLKAVAAISNPEPRQLLIQPWDKGVVQNIEKAIQTSPLGINPVTERTQIRITIPSLTEERRKELVRLLGAATEEARILVRRVREDEMKNIDRREKAGDMSEDEKFRARESVQKSVDTVNKEIDALRENKEKEIMTV
ncbi:MAG: ribosome recycling factor [Patescibacteria group bacterium]